MRRTLRLSARALVALLLALGSAAVAHAQPVVGFIEDFPAANGVGSWGGGSITSNPGTGGFRGAGDGFLDVKTETAGHLGTVSFGTEYGGNWTTAGVTQVRCWLTDLSGRGDLSIHLSISNGFDTYQQNAGFTPPVGSWGLYVVDLNESDFTHTRGTSATFAGVMATVDRLHFRHDVAPYTGLPDDIAGEFGLDHLLLTNGTVGVGPGSIASQPVLLAPPYPNPARGRVTFQLQQPEPHAVTLAIFDAAGRRVRHVEIAAAGPAPRLWLWDGRDDAGAALPAGVYRALATGENGGTSRTVTLLR